MSTSLDFSYMYRDRWNNKKCATFRITDVPDDISILQLEEEFRSLMDDAEYFIAEQVQLPTCYFSSHPLCCDVDHYWHEFNGWSYPMVDQDQPISGTCSLQVLRARFYEAARNGWSEFERTK